MSKISNAKLKGVFFKKAESPSVPCPPEEPHPDGQLRLMEIKGSKSSHLAERPAAKALKGGETSAVTGGEWGEASISRKGQRQSRHQRDKCA